MLLYVCCFFSLFCSSVSCCFFFFQAEDGIRDLTVTGVQTCALPISATLPAALLVIFWWQRGRLSWKRDVLPLLPFFLLAVAAGAVTMVRERQTGAEGRSEERRGGEGGRIRGVPDH